MKAAVTTEDHGFEVVDLPDPTPASDQLVIRVAACGVCGSDIKAQPYAPAGMVMGHELGGEVVAVGSACRRVARGHQCRCAACYFVWNLPVLSDRFGVALRWGELHRDGPGGRLRRVCGRARAPLIRFACRITHRHSALVEPFAVGLHGVHSAEIAAGENVLIVGGGGVGQTTLVWALRKGGVRVTVADPDSRRRDTATALGATEVLASVSDAEPGAYDAVVECVGRPELLQACQPALRPRGRLVISGACAEPTSIEPVTALLKELTVRYSLAYSIGEFEEVVAAFSNGHIDPTSVAGPSFGLDRIAEAFDAVRAAREQGRVSVAP